MLIFALCHCQLPFALCLSGKAGPDFRSRLYQIWHTADFTLFTNFLEGFGYFGTGCSAGLHVFGKLFHVGLELVNATIWSSVLCFFLWNESEEFIGARGGTRFVGAELYSKSAQVSITNMETNNTEESLHEERRARCSSTVLESNHGLYFFLKHEPHDLESFFYYHCCIRGCSSEETNPPLIPTPLQNINKNRQKEERIET